MESFVSFALSYLANNVPTVIELLEKNKSFDARIKDCYDRARNQWNKAASEQYAGKEMEHLDDLKTYLSGNPDGMDNEVEELVGRWILEMRKDPLCAAYINEIKTDKLLLNTAFHAETLSEVARVVDTLNGKIESISSKLDSSITMTKGLERLVEEGNRSILQKIDAGSHFWENRKDDDALVLLDHFFDGKVSRHIPNFDFNGTKLVNQSLWTDEENENLIVNRLKRWGYFLVKGAEGRGKSILCLKAAYRLYLDGYMVFITQKSWDWEKIQEFVEDITSSELKAVIILEDIHKLSVGSNDVISYIQSYCDGRLKENQPLNTLFLVNLRPSLEGEEKLLVNTVSKRHYLELAGEVESNRARGLTDFLVSAHNLVLDQLRVENIPLEDSIPPNLKVLTVFFTIYTDPSAKTSVATKSKVLHLYTRDYGLSQPDDFKVKTLSLLGSLGVFDAPVDSFFLEAAEVALLFRYVNLGFCYFVDNKFYMSHSTDAHYLCLALSAAVQGGGGYVNLVTEAIKSYYERIMNRQSLSEELRKDVGKDFVVPVLQELYRKNEFNTLYGYFRREDISDSILKISPTYIVAALYTNETTPSSRISLYTNNIQLFKKHILDFSSVTLLFIYLILRNHYAYTKGIQDLFDDPEGLVLTEYLNARGKELFVSGQAKVRRNISAIGDFHKSLLEKYEASRSRKKPQLIRTPDFRPKSSLAQVELYQMALEVKEGISYPGTHDQAKHIMDIVAKNVSRFPGCESPYNLSRIFRNLGAIDYDLYLEYINSDDICNEIKYNVSRGRFGISYLFLYSHFYNKNPEIKDLIDKQFLSLTPIARQALRNWIYKIRLHNPGLVFSEGSLAFAVEQALKSSPANQIN